jgi:hypothetical protein
MDDRLLRELGELERREGEDERSRFDERWDRLAAGALTAEEEAELKALAASSPEARETYEAFRPLGADFQARMVAAAAAELAAPTPKAAPPEPAARLLPFRRVARRIEVGVGVAFAVAAGVFFLVHTPALPPLPSYTVDPLIGNQTSRGSASGPERGMPVFASGSPLPIVLHPPPPEEDRGPLEAHAFLVPAGGGKVQWVPLSGFRPKFGDGGAVRLRGGILGETVHVPLGVWRICVVVSRPGKAPPERELPPAPGTEHGDWQAACTEPFKAVSPEIRQPAVASSGAQVDP